LGSVWSRLLSIKCVDGLPLARFEYVLGRAGVVVPRRTLARWVIGTAQALQPLANLLRDAVLGADLIHMDETPVQVLKEPGRAAAAKSYMWVQRGGPPGRPPVLLYDYDPSRSGQVPPRLLLAELEIARGDGRYPRLMRQLARVEVLILDDWGLENSLSDRQRRDLLEILDDRYATRSTLVTSQLPVEQWHHALGDPTLAEAILDRLVHNAHRLPLKGPSMRKQRQPITVTP
jgi:hypothetical protein